jgi:hypothetical protein
LYDGIAKVCVSVYEDAKKSAETLRVKDGRTIYITPYTYLQYLSTFKGIYT